MSYEFLTYEQKERITYVTINRPERLNALHPPANAELYDAFTRFNDDPDAWVAIITGSRAREPSARATISGTRRSATSAATSREPAPTARPSAA